MLANFMLEGSKTVKVVIDTGFCSKKKILEINDTEGVLQAKLKNIQFSFCPRCARNKALESVLKRAWKETQNLQALDELRDESPVIFEFKAILYLR